VNTALKRGSGALLASLALVLTGCGGNHYSDLDACMAETRARPGKAIPPPPVFKAYKTFTYAAASLRAPFDRPLEVEQRVRASQGQAVQPDLERSPEFLERFALDSLSLVGSLAMGDTLWALIQDGEGGVHRVRPGNYLGRNHGRIIELEPDRLSLVEVVPTGGGGWVERPRQLELKTSSN